MRDSGRGMNKAYRKILPSGHLRYTRCSGSFHFQVTSGVGIRERPDILSREDDSSVVEVGAISDMMVRGDSVWCKVRCWS